jgi:hypothetical protein
MVEGSCLCGRVRYEIDGKISGYWLCHCSKCRRVSGGPFAAAALCRREAFRWLSGEDQVKSFDTGSGYIRTFCTHCGSPAPLMQEGHGSVILMPGTLDEAYDGSLARHILVGSKAEWWSITDDAPQFEEHAR